MTEDELRSVFKPDKYGFCHVTMSDGKVQGFWFDTVLKVNEVQDHTWKCCVDCGALYMTHAPDGVCRCGSMNFGLYYQGERL